MMPEITFEWISMFSSCWAVNLCWKLQVLSCPVRTLRNGMIVPKMVLIIGWQFSHFFGLPRQTRCMRRRGTVISGRTSWYCTFFTPSLVENKVNHGPFVDANYGWAKLALLVMMHLVCTNRWWFPSVKMMSHVSIGKDISSPPFPGISLTWHTVEGKIFWWYKNALAEGMYCWGTSSYLMQES